MSERVTPQLYLLTPPVFETGPFLDSLAPVLDAAAVACLRLRSAAGTADDIARQADALRELAHARDIPLVIEAHLGLVARLGLDGVHLTEGARGVREARKDLGGEAIIGAFCGTSRHHGMAAGEAGADYIAFGPVRDTGLGTGGQAEAELFGWWSEMIELPVVAEGAVGEAEAQTFGKVADFIALGAEIWDAEDPPAQMRRYAALLGG